MSPDPRLIRALAALVQRRRPGRPFVLGLCGAQGSGKSTLAAALVAHLRAEGLACAVLSIDDLYLTRAERAALAASVHPLLATRGVPGTHDVALGLDILARLDRGEDVVLPRFDKAADDRAPRERWTTVPAGLDLLVLEGWCVGARPQPEAALRTHVNALEREEDAHGIWRRHVNACLAGPYQQLFARLDALALLAAPSFDVVAGWRLQQEQDLGPAATMDAARISRFVRFYERLTRHVLAEMPARADLVARLGPDRAVVDLVSRGTPSRPA